MGWRNKCFLFNTILIYCDKIQQHSPLSGCKRTQKKKKKITNLSQNTTIVVSTKSSLRFSRAHTHSALRSPGTLPDPALQAKEHFLFTSLKQTLITGGWSIQQHWKHRWPTPDCAWLVPSPRCEHLLRSQKKTSILGTTDVFEWDYITDREEVRRWE